MSLIKTIGSLALNEATKFVAKKAWEKIAKEITPKWNGGVSMSWGWTTSVDAEVASTNRMQKIANERAAEDALQSDREAVKQGKMTIQELWKRRSERVIAPTTQEEITKLAATSSIESKIAQEEGYITFGSSTPLWPTIEKVVDMDALGNIRLSVVKAKRQLEDFVNPKSKLAQAFKNSLGEKRYDFAKMVKETKEIATQRASIESSEGEWAKTLSDMGEAYFDGWVQEGVTNTLDAAFWTTTWKNIRRAKEFNLETWKETSSPIAEGVAGFVSDAPKYAAMGLASWPAALLQISNLGLNIIKGKKWIEVAKFASKLETMQATHPTLYAATVDNALTTALDYTWREVVWMDNSIWDVVNNLLLWVALPTWIKGIAEGWKKAFGNVTPKDIKNLEKALFEEVEASVDKDPRRALTNIIAKWETYFEDGTTLTQRTEEAKQIMKSEKERVTTLSPEEVISEFANWGITVTKAGGRMIAEAINNLNTTIKWETDMGELLGFGDVGNDGRALLTKQAIMENLQTSGVANEASVTKAIDDAKKANGVEINVKKQELTDEEQFEELLSNPDNEIENLLDAKNADDIKKAVEWAKNTKKATKEGLDGLRWATSTNELKLDDLQAMADEQGVKINPKKLYKPQSPLETKAPELDKDYINKIIDEVELKRTWYSGIKSTVMKTFRASVRTVKGEILTRMEELTWKKYKSKFLKWKWEYTWENADEFVPDDIIKLLKWEDFEWNITFWDLSQRDINKLIKSWYDGKITKPADINRVGRRSMEEIEANIRNGTEVVGKDVEKELKKSLSLVTGLNKEMSDIVNRLKWVITQNERIKLVKLRERTKVRIQKIRDSFEAKLDKAKWKTSDLRKKQKDTNFFIKYVKDSIDMAGSQYTRSYFRPASSAKQVESAQVAELRWQTPRAIRTTPWYVTETVLSKAKINEIKNKYKALIHPTTSVARATELMKRMDEELHKLSYDKMEADADTLITKVMNAATHKKTKASVDIGAVMKMADTYIKIRKAGGDLDRMRDLIVDLENFHREGKDAFKTHIAEKKADVSSTVKEALGVLDRMWDSMFGLRGRNTPTDWELWGFDFINDGVSWWSNSVSASLNIPRLFNEAKWLTKVFLGNFQKAQTLFTNIRRDVVDIHWVNALREANKLLKTNEGDASYKLTLWMRRNTEFWQEGNMMSAMTLKRTGAWKWEVLFIKDPKGHKDAKRADYDRWDYVRFSDAGNDELKESILESIYRPFDEAMTRWGKFKDEIDWIKAHFSQTWDDIIDIGKRSFNKIDFHKQDSYFPSAVKWKVGEDTAIDPNGKYDSNMQESIQNGFLKKKVKPSMDNVRNMEMGFVENLAYHTDTAIWWKLNIENLVTADATLRQLRKWRKGVDEAAENIKIEEENLFDMRKFLEDWEWSTTSNLDNPMLTLEAERYLRDHIGKIATRGRSINSFGGDAKFLNRLLNHANKVILWVPEVAIKQTMGYPVIALHAGWKNMVWGIRNSTWNWKNLDFAYKASGTLMERQATYKSAEGRGVAHFVTQNDTWTKYFWKLERGYDQTMEGLIGNTTKFVDGAVSWNAWMSGMSKYLDEQGIVKSGWAYDLEKIAIQLGDEKWSEAVAYADEMMGRIMGSNTLVDKALLANSMLTKTTMLFMRTWLHQMVSAFDTLAEVANSSKFKWDSKTRQHLLAVAQWGKIFMASIAITMMNETVNEGRVYSKRIMGVKEEKDQFATRELISWKVIEDPTDLEIAMDIAKRYITSVTASPSLSPDILAWWSGMFTWVQKVMTASTLERQAEELSYAVMRGFVPSTYADLIRWWVTKNWIGLNPVDAKVYDAAVKQIKEDNPNAENQPNFDEQVSTKIRITEEQKVLSDAKKPEKEAEKKFIEEGLKKYWKDITIEEAAKLYKNTPWIKEVTSLNQLKALQTKVQVASAKWEWEINSLLQGKSNEVIFNVVIKDMVDIWDIEWAKAKVMELRKKWVIKSNKWVIDMMKILIKYRSLK